MLLKKKEAEFGAPVGSYLAEFLGTTDLPNDKPKLGRDGKPMKPAIEWQWRIILGKFKGRIVGRITSKEPTAKNSCGVLLDGVADRAIRIDEEFDPDTMKGKRYRVAVDKQKDNPEKTQVVGVYPPDDEDETPSDATPKSFKEIGY